MGYSDETSASEARGLQRERRDLEVQRCAAAEDVCGRQVACVFALTTALALMGLDWTPLTTGVTRRRLRPEYLQVVVGAVGSQARRQNRQQTAWKGLRSVQRHLLQKRNSSEDDRSRPRCHLHLMRIHLADVRPMAGLEVGEARHKIKA